MANLELVTIVVREYDRRLVSAGVELVTTPRDEAYGRVVVFVDISGNRWDMLGPA